jgi:hypothetical protein
MRRTQWFASGAPSVCLQTTWAAHVVCGICRRIHAQGRDWRHPRRVQWALLRHMPHY